MPALLNNVKFTTNYYFLLGAVGLLGGFLSFFVVFQALNGQPPF